jgi:hypothetical protein
MKGSIVIILIGLVLTQVGCAASSGRPQYPIEWASIKTVPTDDGCPNLQGTYNNKGSATYPLEAGAPPSLADIFKQLALGQGPNSPAAWNQSWPLIPLDTSVVSIDQKPEMITVAFINSRGEQTSLDFRRYRFRLSEERVDDLFRCRVMYGEPSLSFFAEPHSFSDATNVYIVGGGTMVVLLKSADGSLVVNWRSDSVALTLFVLGSGYRVNNLWYRYPLIASENQPNDNHAQ